MVRSLADQPTPELQHVLAGGGEMGAMIRSYDWSRTPLGPIEGWQQSLKTAVRIMLNSRYPMFVWWGQALINLYNDAYIPILGARHPRGLGAEAATLWADAWPVLGPQADLVLRAGQATWNESILLVMERYGYPEETYFTFSYSPVPNDAGGVGGLFCACTEDTGRVLGARRLKTLRDLGERDLSEPQTAESACRAAAAALGANLHDVPFALIYLLDEDGNYAQLCATSNLDAGSAASPRTVAVAGDDALWPFRQVLETRAGQLVEGLEARVGRLPAGPWADDWPRRALVLPLAKAGAPDLPAGVLVAGLSPRLPLTDDYRGFLTLAASHIATAIANARAYEAERRRAEALAEIDRAKTVFFSNVSHEFRTPLTLLLGPAEDALAHTDDEAQRERLRIIHRNALRLQKLVNTLLDFSRIEAGRIQAVFEPTDLATLTVDLASNFRSAVERAGLSLRIDCQPLAEPVLVDRDMYEKVVLNLISNAFKFTAAGEIAVELREAGDAVELVVRDTGTGIAPEDLPHIFERFHRVTGGWSRTHEGTGIGLALVRELVGLHGGTVGVESAPGQGSSFTVRLPRGAGRRAGSPAARAGAPPPTSLGAQHFLEEIESWAGPGDALSAGVEAGPGRPQGGALSHEDARARIVWADDNADMRDYVRRLLADRYDVVAVANGRAALAAIAAHPPDLVLADVMMPELDGFALVRALRADPATQALPVILLSARAGEEARIAGLEEGVDDYLTKPFSARELLARVQTHLQVGRLRREVAESVIRSEERIRLALDVAQLGTWSWEPGPDLVLADRRCREIWGLPAQGDLSLDDFVPRFHAEDWPRIHAALEAAIALDGDGLYAEEFRIICPDRGTRWLAARGQAFFAGEGAARHPTLMLGTVLDISARKSAEDALRQSRDDLELRVAQRTAELRAANEALRAEIRQRILAEDERRKLEAQMLQAQKLESLGVLAGGIAHDFNNLLTSILGYADLALLDLPPGSPTRPMLEAVIGGARRAADLSNQMLAYSGKGRFVIEPQHLSTLVEEIGRLLQISIAKKCVLRYQLQPGLPAIDGDAAQLRQIVMNLIINASEAIGDRPGVISVRTGLTYCDQASLARTYLDDQLPAGQYVFLEVRDDGPGMSPETRAKIFDPFFTTKFTGRGLGLAAVLGIVRGHHGAIRVESAPGEGSCFTVYFPASASRGPAAPPAAGATGWRGSGTVLVVDDEESVVAMARQMLEALGFTVVTAPNGRAGLDLFRADPSRFCLVLLDLTMPSLDGAETFAAMRRIRGDLRAILSSGYDEETVAERFADRGLVGFLQKPYYLAELREVVRRALEG